LKDSSNFILITCSSKKPAEQLGEKRACGLNMTAVTIRQTLGDQSDGNNII